MVPATPSPDHSPPSGPETSTPSPAPIEATETVEVTTRDGSPDEPAPERTRRRALFEVPMLPRLLGGSLARAALFAAVVSVLATGVLRWLAVAAGLDDTFWPITFLPLVSAFGAVGAVAVYAVVVRMIQDPVTRYLQFAVSLLALSMAAPLGLLLLPGGTVGATMLLAASHVAVAVVSVATLLNLDADVPLTQEDQRRAYRRTGGKTPKPGPGPDPGAHPGAPLH